MTHPPSSLERQLMTHLEMMTHSWNVKTKIIFIARENKKPETEKMMTKGSKNWHKMLTNEKTEFFLVDKYFNPSHAHIF